MIDLLKLELHDDIPKQFNQAWEKVVWSLDETWIRIFWTICTKCSSEGPRQHSDIIPRREPKSFHRLRAVVNDHLDDWRHVQLISQQDHSRESSTSKFVKRR